jgi:hypothetical protein
MSGPASSSVFIIGRMPPMATSSDIKCLPLGFKSASTGTRFPIFVKSSRPSLTFAAFAIASRCSTAFVEPPSAITTVMAFSNALRVMMSSGFNPSRSKFTTAAPAFRLSFIFAGDTAACAELFGRLMPIASIALAIVFAVYIPPHDPGPGIAHDSMASSSASSIFLFACAPTASNTDTMSSLRVSPVMQPGKIVPPYTNTAGRFNRASAISDPGMFLSHPPMATNPSIPSHAATVSIESAITSRDTSEYFMPSDPIEMPSETLMVLNTIALPPASFAPFSASSASLSMCMLHGVTMLHVDAMPTMGFLKSSGLNPTG